MKNRIHANTEYCGDKYIQNQSSFCQSISKVHPLFCALPMPPSPPTDQILDKPISPMNPPAKTIAIAGGASFMLAAEEAEELGTELVLIV